ncbi:MAG: Ref family recombination enhancement nuclease [Pikeienuella sp.]
MNQITPREPLGQKVSRPAKNPEYLRKVKLLPCCICSNFGMMQTSPTDAHHSKSGRFGARKTPDEMTIPLCKCHHQGLRFDRDKTKVAFHQSQAEWERLYGPDYDYIPATQDAVEAMT